MNFFLEISGKYKWGKEGTTKNNPRKRVSYNMAERLKYETCKYGDVERIRAFKIKLDLYLRMSPCLYPSLICL